MKKIGLLFTLILLLAAAQLYGGELATPTGSITLSERVDENSFVHYTNSEGAAYLLYTEDGRLKAQKSTDQGATYNEVAVDLKGLAFAAVHSLKLYEPSYNEGVVLFIGENGGNESIYLLDLNSGVQPELLSTTPLDSPERWGSMKGYKVYPAERDAFTLAFIKGGHLFLREMANKKEPGSLIRVAVDSAEAFTFEQRFINDELKQSGTLLSSVGTGERLTYFELENGTLTNQVELAYSNTKDTIKHKIVKDKSGRTTAILNNDGLLVAKEISGGSAKELSSSPLNRAGSRAMGFEIMESASGFTVLYSALEGGVTNLYGVVLNGKGEAARLKGGAPLNRGALKGEFKLHYDGFRSYYAAFAELLQGKESLSLFRWEKGNSYERYENLSSYLAPPEAQLNFSFHESSRGTTVLQYLAGGSEPTQLLYELPFSSFGNERMEVRELSRTVLGSTTFSGEEPICLGDNFIRKVGERTYIFNLVSGAVEELTGTGLTGAVQGSDDAPLMVTKAVMGTTLYNLSASLAPPKGALWTTGTPALPGRSYCRVYIWDDKEPGKLTIWVQQNGYTVPVTWNGVKQGGSEEYIRAYNFNPGEKVELELEVYRQGRRVDHYRLVVGPEQAPVLVERQKGELAEIRAVIKPPVVNSDIRGIEAKSMMRADVQMEGMTRATLNSASSTWDGHVPVTEVNTGSDASYSISNGQLVWYNYNGVLHELFFWDSQEKVAKLITNSSHSQYGSSHWYFRHAKIDDGQVVWIDHDGSDYEVFFWDSRDGIVRQVSNNTYYDDEPDISGGQVVWRGYDGNDTEIFLWDSKKQVVENITNNVSDEYNPAIDNGQVVWELLDIYDFEHEIIFWDSKDRAAIQITDNIYNDSKPQINNGQVVWRVAKTNSSTDQNVCFWDSKERAIIQITNDRRSLHEPHIDNGQVVWSDRTLIDKVDNEIYFWDSNERVVRLLQGDAVSVYPPQISKGQVVWNAHKNYKNELLIWDSKTKIVRPIYNNLINIDTHFIPYSVKINNGMVALCNLTKDKTKFTLYTYKVDWMGPEMALSQHGPGGQLLDGWSKYNPTFIKGTLVDSNIGVPTGINPSSLKQRINNGAWTSISYNDLTTKGIQISDEGNNLLELYGEDYAGNAATASINIKIDYTKPAIILPNLPNWFNKPLDLMAELVETHSGIKAGSGLYKIGDMGSWQSTNNFIVNVAAEGETNVYFRVYDNAGNMEENFTTVKIDRTVPLMNSITVNGEPFKDGFYYNGQVNIVASAHDVHSGVDSSSWQYKVGNSSFQNGSSLSINTSGQHEILFKVKDKAGNEASIIKTIFLDNSPPIITATGNYWNSNQENFAGATAADSGGSGLNPDSWYYRTSYDPAGSWYKIFTTTNGGASVEHAVAAEGAVTVYFRVKDMAGNEATADTVVMKDSKAPLYSSSTFSSLPGKIITRQGNTNIWVNYPYIDVTAAFDDGLGSGVNEIEHSFNRSLWNHGATAQVTAEGVTTVYFRGRDLMGFSSVEKAIQVRIDRTAPTITGGALSASSFRDSLTFSTLPAASDNLSETIRLDYSLDGTNWAPFDNTIDLTPLAEGSYSLQLRASDIAGNETIDPTAYPFTIDRTAPAISSLKVVIHNQEIAEGRYARYNSLEIVVQGSEPLSGYNWSLEPHLTATPALSNYTASSDNFYTGLLNEGRNHLYVQPIDSVGNLGTALYREILVDTSVPGTVVIRGLSHPPASKPEDAISAKEASFSFNAPANGPSGISKYSYELKRGVNESSAVGLNLPGFVGHSDGRLDLFNLPDNGEGEYYYLYLFAYSGSWREGPKSYYRFRVDSSPPKNLRVTSTSHANSELYYSSRKAVFKWNRPLDFTGVKSYYYKSATTKILPEPFDPSADPVDLTWTATKSDSLTLDLAALTGSKAGQIYLALCAEDFAGNRQYSETSVKFDIEKPTLPAGLTITPLESSKSVQIVWPTPLDNVAVDRVELRLAKSVNGSLEYLNSWLPRMATLHNHEFRGLDTDHSINYALFIKVVDSAGNEKSYVEGFSFSGLPVNVDFTIPFSDTINGYRIRGEYSANPALRKAYFQIPGGCYLYFPATRTNGEELELGELSFSPEGDFLGGSYRAADFHLTFAGYRFAAQGLIFSRSEGLKFETLGYGLTPYGGAWVRSLFTNVNVTAPPALIFSKSTALTPSFALLSLRPAANGQPEESLWLFRNIVETGLEENRWQLNRGDLDLSDLSADLNGYRLEAGGVKSRLIPITGMGISAEKEPLKGEIAAEFYLDKGGNSYLVKKAQIEGDRIVILEADLILGGSYQGVTPRPVKVRNFSINVKGLLKEERGFEVTPFSFTAGSYSYSINEFTLVAGKMVTKGTMNVAGSPINFTGLMIEKEGINFGTGTEAGAFNHTYSGFKVSGAKSYIQGEKLIIPTAAIELPLNFGGGVQTIYNLEVSISNYNNILTAASADVNFDITGSAYGAPLHVKRILLDNSGLKAERVVVDLPQFIQSPRTLELSGITLNAAGTIGESQVKATFDFNIQGFALKGANLKLKGGNVVVGSTTVAMKAGTIPGQLIFNDLEFNSSALVKAGTTAATMDFKVNTSWPVVLKEIKLAENGISGLGEVTLEAGFAGSELSFPNFTLKADGTYVAGGAEGLFMIKGWLVDGESISLSNGQLTLGTALVELYSDMTDDSLSIPNVVLDQSGDLVSSEIGNKLVNFTSTNGFYVESNSASFSQDGLKLGGKVFFPESLGSDVSFDYQGDILLSGTGAITTPVKTGPLTYSLAGWDVEADSFYFNEEGLTIESSHIPLWQTGKMIPMPLIRFYPDGEISIGESSTESFSFSYRGFEVEISDVMMTTERVQVEAMIALPPTLGGERLYLERLTLNKDGTMSTDLNIPEFTFTLFNMEFSLEMVSFTDEGFKAEKAYLKLPETEFNGRTLMLTDLVIGSDGSFRTGYNYPFDLWDYIFNIESLSVSGNRLTLGGTVTLPDDFFISKMAGLELNLTSLTIDMERPALVDFTVTIEEEFSFELYDRWEVRCKDITLKKDSIEVKVATLMVPDYIGIGEVDVTNINFNLLTKDVTIGGIDVSFLGPVEYGGMIFEMTSLAISKERGLDFGGSVTLGETYPEGLRGLKLTIDKFQVKPDGTVGDIIASAGGLPIINMGTSFILRDGVVTFKKVDSALRLGIAGNLELGTAFPAGMQGKIFKINTFELDGKTGAVTAFNAAFDTTTGGPSFKIFNATSIEATALGLSYDNSNKLFKIDVSGNIKLLNSFPDELYGQTLQINQLVINSKGEVEKASAQTTLAVEKGIWGDTFLTPGTIKAELNQTKDGVIFSALNSSIRFGTSFPSSISASPLQITTLQFESSGKVLALDAGKSLNNLTLFDNLQFSNGDLRLKKTTADPELSISGTFTLPNTFPTGLAGKALVIDKFTITSGGTVKELSTTAANLSLNIWNNVSITNGSLGLSKDASLGSNEILFNLGGDVTLASTLDKGIADSTYRIKRMTISNTRGLQEFTVQSVGELKKKLFTGVDFNFRELSLAESGIGLAGSISFDPSQNSFMPPQMADTTIDLTEFKMKWSGAITSINASLSTSINVELGGFETTFQGITVTKDSVGIAYCGLTLPANMNAKRLEVRNASFTWDGRFTGTLGVSDINLDYAGFGLQLVSPGLDITNKSITFTQANLTMPEMVGGSGIILNGVSVSHKGIRLNGIGFELPNFKVAGGLGFRDVRASFVAATNNSDFSVEAGGKIMIPGTGTFDVILSFTEISKSYPIGLKQASFSYQVHGLGLPIGNTGLYLNKIRGSLVYGKPTASEMPNHLHPYFDNGIRLSLGVGIIDGSRGNLFKGNVDSWIDVTDWDWAFNGDVTILRGLVKGNMYAVMGNGVFSGGVSFRMRFVKGSVKIDIFEHNGSTIVNGAGRVNVGLAKGKIINKKIPYVVFKRVRKRKKKKWKVWRYWVWVPRTRYKRISIPSSDMWLPSVNANFGTFTNGRKGFNGYVNVPVWGRVGFFVGSGGVSFKGIGSYELLQPNLHQALTRSMSAELAGLGPVQESSELSGKYSESFIFNVPGSEPVSLQRSRALLTDGAIQYQAAPLSSPALNGAVEKLVFFLYYEQGSPQVTAISPGGVRYSMSSANVEVTNVDNGMYIVIKNPEAGRWNLEVNNLIDPNSYHIEVLGKERFAELSVEAAAVQGPTGRTYTVTGSATNYSGTAAMVKLYLSKEQNSSIGEEIATVTAQADNSFSYTLDPATLKSGRYYLYAAVEDGDNPDVLAYAAGEIVIDNSNLALKAVENFTASVDASDDIELRFNDSNGKRAKGFILIAENVTDPQNITKEEIDLGYLTEALVPGFKRGDTIRLTIRAYDNFKVRGASGSSIELTIGEVKEQKNLFTVGNITQTLPLNVGGEASGTITILPQAPLVTGTAYDYVKVESVTVGNPDLTNDKLAISFNGQAWNMASGETSIGYTVNAFEGTPAGDYPIKVKLCNAGNSALSSDVTITARLSYPKPLISGVKNREWYQDESGDLEIYGENFLPGTKLLFGTGELNIIERTDGLIKAEVAPGQPGGKHIVTVKAPGNYDLTTDITVLAPSYKILTLKDGLTLNPGSTGKIEFTLEGENRFSGTAGFTIQGAPAGWDLSGDITAVVVDEMTLVEVTVPATTPAGSYPLTLRATNGEQKVITVDVVSQSLAPTIYYLSIPEVEFGANLLAIEGHGFGNDSIVRLETRDLTVDSYAGDELLVIIPPDAQTGLITVESGGKISNSVTYYAFDRGFELKPGSETLELEAGESREMAVIITGYADEVTLSLDAGLSGVTASIDRTKVIPNGELRLSVNVPAGMAVGRYPLTLTGTFGTLTKSVTVNVDVGLKFGFANAGLSGAEVGRHYSEQLSVVNGSGKISFIRLGGFLPPGLTMSGDGLISGRPTQAGDYSFTIEASTEQGRVVEKQFTLTVNECSWGLPDGNSGANRYQPVLSGGNSRLMWKSKSYAATREILSGNGKIFLLTNGGIKALDRNSGFELYSYDGQFSQWGYSAGTLYLLRGDRVLIALNAHDGTVRREYGNVYYMTINGGKIYFSQSGQIKIVDIKTDTLEKTVYEKLCDTSRYFWYKDELYRYKGNAVDRLNITANRFDNVLTYTIPIVEGVADENNIALLLGNGKVQLLDSTFTLVRETTTTITTGHLALSTNELIVGGASQAIAFSRVNLAPIYAAPLKTEVLAITADRLFIGSQLGFASVTPTGIEWQTTGWHKDITVGAEGIYLLGNDGTISHYGGAIRY